MVFTTVANLVRSRGPDEFWRKRKILKLAAHFIGRRRNCYSIAVRYVHRALVYATKGRKLKREDLRHLWESRLVAACGQSHLSLEAFQEGLARNNVLLNRKTLSDLAVWEPRTFKALTDIANEQARKDDLDTVTTRKEPIGCGITRKGEWK